MEHKNKDILKVCEDCIHREVCKYKENLKGKDLEEPLELNCKYKQLIFRYITTPSYINQTPNFNTSYSICKNCCYLVDGECKAPDNMAGLPCQIVTCKI